MNKFENEVIKGNLHMHIQVSVEIEFVELQELYFIFVVS